MDDVLGGDGVFVDWCRAVVLEEDEGNETGMLGCVRSARAQI